MSRQVKLYPGSTPDITQFKFWIDIELNDESKELWIDIHQFDHQGSNIDWNVIDASDRVVVFDIFHASPLLDTSRVQRISSRKPTQWITTNPVPVPGVKTIHFDYYWNRCKKAFLEKIPLHKLWGPDNFQQYPIHFQPRPRKYLTYHSRPEHIHRQLHDHLVTHYSGFYTDPAAGHWLKPNKEEIDGQQWTLDRVAPPARRYYDESYITCVVESQCLGTNFTISEKTYDNLIQGRGVLNFAPCGFYQYLADQGWAMPSGIDWSWNQIQNDEHRFVRYLEEIDRLLLLNLNNLHQWFLSNVQCWEHNQRMLEIKPYDIIDTTSI